MAALVVSGVHVVATTHHHCIDQLRSWRGGVLKCLYVREKRKEHALVIIGYTRCAWW